MRAYELLEYRRAGSRYPKQAAIDVLKKYENQDDVYVSFTEIEKLGINPQSNYNTPLGIYSYPLKAAMKVYGVRSIEDFPFANDAPYIWIFKAQAKDVVDFTEIDLKKTIKTITADYPDITKNDIKNWMETAGIRDTEDDEVELLADEMDEGKYAAYIWNITRLGTKNSKKWNHILRKLGYNGISDKTGIGLIHANEPCQAVFFSIRGLEILEKIHNISPETPEYGEKVKQDNHTANVIIPKLASLKNNPQEQVQYIVDNNINFQKGIGGIQLISYLTFYAMNLLLLYYLKNPTLGNTKISEYLISQLQHLTLDDDLFSEILKHKTLFHQVKKPTDKQVLMVIKKALTTGIMDGPPNNKLDSGTCHWVASCCTYNKNDKTKVKRELLKARKNFQIFPDAVVSMVLYGYLPEEDVNKYREEFNNRWTG
jgi:hypothetical protein